MSIFTRWLPTLKSRPSGLIERRGGLVRVLGFEGIFPDIRTIQMSDPGTLIQKRDDPENDPVALRAELRQARECARWLKKSYADGSLLPEWVDDVMARWPSEVPDDDGD